MARRNCSALSWLAALTSSLVVLMVPSSRISMVNLSIRMALSSPEHSGCGQHDEHPAVGLELVAKVPEALDHDGIRDEPLGVSEEKGGIFGKLPSQGERVRRAGRHHGRVSVCQ